MSGLVPDARTLVDHARVDAQNYTFSYNEPIPIESVTQSICDLSIRFGEDRGEEEVMSRPFGVALLVAGVDERGAVLYHTDPAGNYTQYVAKAIGNGSDSAQTLLEAQYYKSIDLESAKILALTVLRQVMEEKLTSANVELSTVTVAEKKLVHIPTATIEVRSFTFEFLPFICVFVYSLHCLTPSHFSFTNRPSFPNSLLLTLKASKCLKKFVIKVSCSFCPPIESFPSFIVHILHNCST